MTDCNALPIEFPGFGGRKIEADFSGGEVSSDGGVLVLRQVDRWVGLTKRLGQLLPDPRDPARIIHPVDDQPAVSAGMAPICCIIPR